MRSFSVDEETYELLQWAIAQAKKQGKANANINHAIWWLAEGKGYVPRPTQDYQSKGKDDGEQWLLH